MFQNFPRNFPPQVGNNEKSLKPNGNQNITRRDTGGLGNRRYRSKYNLPKSKRIHAHLVAATLFTPFSISRRDSRKK